MTEHTSENQNEGNPSYYDFEHAGTALPDGETIELEQVVPLLARANELGGHLVTLWIVGGLRLSGRLTWVNENDLVLTVTDTSDRYDVALSSVAVIQSREA